MERIEPYDDGMVGVLTNLQYLSVFSLELMAQIFLGQSESGSIHPVLHWAQFVVPLNFVLLLVSYRKRLVRFHCTSL